MGASKLSIDPEDRSPARRPTRRWVLRALGVSGLAASAAGISLSDALAGKGKKNKSKNKNKNKKNRCPGGLMRCHAVCAEAGIVCCPASSDGLLGVCPPSHPHCCPLSLYGGCCPPAYPVCCAEECCAPGETCGSDGYCRSS